MGKEIGIDFGTTNTVISYINKKGKLRQLRYEGQEIIPTVIYFLSKNEYLIGNDAKKRYKFKKNKAGCINFKPKVSEKEKYNIVAEDGSRLSLRPKDITKLFLNKLIRGIEERLIKEFGPIDGYIEKVVITVPAKFSSSEKEAIRKAAQNAGLKTAKLAAEPTAAAIAYQNDIGEDESNQEKAVLVYDFGGGTFDVSVIQKENGKFKEIATNGDKDLGGNKLTACIAEEILNRINDDYGMEMPFDEEEFDEEICEMSRETYEKNIISIYQVANSIKEYLSEELNTSELVNIDFEGKNLECEIDFSRKDLEKCIKKEIKHTIEITKNTIDEAKEKGAEISQVVLAGGSSNIPLVKEMLEEKLSRNDVVYCDDVSTLISRGAAVMANKAQEMSNMTMQITNVQLGIAATEGVQYGKFQVIIPENELLPCTKYRNFNLSQDGQRRLDIVYYERDIKNYPNAIRIDDNGINEIDTLIIDNLPSGLKKDEVIVEVKFTAQSDGSLDINVNIKDNNGDSIKQGELLIVKESDLE